MPANCGADTHSVGNAVALPTTIPIKFFITSQGTQVFAHIKLSISSGH